MMDHWEYALFAGLSAVLIVWLAALLALEWWTRYRQWRAVPKGYFGRVYGADARQNEWRRN